MASKAKLDDASQKRCAHDGRAGFNLDKHSSMAGRLAINSVNPRYRVANSAIVLCLFIFATSSSFAFCKFFLTRGAEQQKLVRAEQTKKPEDIQAAEGTDEKSIDQNTIDSYKVAPDQPRIISISKIGVRARILPMGLNPDTSIQAPTNINDTGWYRDSVKPGQIGTSLIDGHDLGVTRAGVFYKLKNLSNGDRISIEMGDGKIHIYAVVAKTVQHLNDVDMSNVIANTDNHTARLILMTCDGAVVKENGKVTQDHRVIITAELVK